MSLTQSSRYVDGEFLWVPGRGTDKYAVSLNTVTLLTAPYIVHVAREGDTLHTLAVTYYQREDRWWILADANPHVFNPFDLQPGDPIRVPQ